MERRNEHEPGEHHRTAGADVDLRYTTTSQKAVARMSIAVNDR